MPYSVIPLCVIALLNATSGQAHSLPVLEARAKGSKSNGASASNALDLDDYSAGRKGSHKNGMRLSKINIIIICVISVISLILIVASIFLCLWVRRRRKRKTKTARDSFSEDTQYIPDSTITGGHHQELKTDEQQPLYSEQHCGLNIDPSHRPQRASYVSHATHASHDSTHDQHLSLLSAYNYASSPGQPSPYANSPPNQYSPLHNQDIGGCFEPSCPAPAATTNGLHYSTPPSGGEADGYYAR